MKALDYFKNDRFATHTGVALLEIKPGYAKGQLTVGPQHINAGGTTQGGVIFTLADTVMGAASNAHGEIAFSINGNINFLRGSKPGDVLTAVAKERFLHKRLGHYQIDVTNQLGELIATLEGTVYRKGIPIDLEC
jgi:acyl-CoA thioesterase